MSADFFRETLSKGWWSIEYHPDVVRAKLQRAPRLRSAVPESELPGVPVVSAPLQVFLRQQAAVAGWKTVSNFKVQVAVNAKSYRTPEPRYSAAKLPCRSSFALYLVEDNQPRWRLLEDRVAYLDLDNQHALLELACTKLVTVFAPLGVPSLEASLSG